MHLVRSPGAGQRSSAREPVAEGITVYNNLKAQVDKG